jgi:hypothetical protein
VTCSATHIRPICFMLAGSNARLVTGNGVDYDRVSLGGSGGRRADAADAEVEDAAERGLNQADERPFPLRRVAHLTGASDIGQAEDFEADPERRDKQETAGRADQDRWSAL